MANYNGWTNYETWRVNLEIFDGMRARDISGSYVNSPSELKELCKEYAQELIENSSSEGLARDYALSFLDAVNWWEIADHLMSEEEEDEE